MKGQYVTVPNEVAADKELELLDTLVYATIKKFMNRDTMTCYPSIETIREISGLSKDRIQKGIRKLESLGYIHITLDGRRNVYRFDPHKNFEIFSFDFLEDKNMSPTEKALQLRMQRLMVINGNEGCCTKSDAECAREINVSRSTFDRTIKSMKQKGLVEIVPTRTYEGLTVNGKYFKLDELQQAIVYKLKEHEERVKTVEEQLADALKRIQQLERKEKLRDAIDIESVDDGVIA